MKFYSSTSLIYNEYALTIIINKMTLETEEWSPVSFPLKEKDCDQLLEAAGV